MEEACKEFLRALKQAEEKGTSVTIAQLEKYIITIPPGKTAADVYETCKSKGWVMGSPQGVWLTPEGIKHIGTLH